MDREKAGMSVREWAQVAHRRGECYAWLALPFAALFRLAPGARERADYVGVEMEFMRRLAAQEAEAWEAGATDRAVEVARVGGSFLSQHLGAWFPRFVERALQHAGTDFYRGHLLMVQGFLAQDLERLSLIANATGGEGSLDTPKPPGL